MVGETISHYRILEKLGEGGMGVVYKAQDTTLDRIVALKFLPDRVNKDETAKARFLQEAKAVAALNHSNICTIFGVEEHEHQLCMSMEFVEGGTLREKIPFAKIDDAITIATQIGDALQEAHAKGIVHRDIKADNVMLTSKGQAKVMDFGLAKLKGAMKLTRTSSTVGTLGYMAPEQIQGGEVDHRSDIFSFGVLLFEMLTGRLPFRGEHEAAMVYSIVNEDPQEVTQLIPDLTPIVVNLIQRCLEKDPNDRYQHFDDIVADLRRSQKKTSRVMRSSPHVSAHRPDEDVSSHETATVKVHAPGIFQKNSMRIGIASVVVVIIVLIAWFMSGSSRPAINPNMKISTLQIPATEYQYPDMSPDGKWLAFPGADINGKWDIYLMFIESGESRRLTSDSSANLGNAATARFSPDGSSIVYARRKNSSTIADVCVVSMLTGSSRVVADSGIAPSWSPSGDRIFFYRSREGNRAPSHSGWREYRSVSLNGSDSRIEFIDSLLQGSLYYFTFRVSPDGKKMLFTRPMKGDYNEIIVHDLPSGKETQLTHDKKIIDEVFWADNGYIFYSSNKSGNFNIWAMPESGGDARQITRGAGPDYGISVSTAANRLIFSQRTGISTLWMVNADGSSNRQVYPDENIYNSSIASDGTTLALEVQDRLEYNSTLMVRDIKSGRQEFLFPFDSIRTRVFPTWSPTGNLLSYITFGIETNPAIAHATVMDMRMGKQEIDLGEGIPVWWITDSTLIIRKNTSTDPKRPDYHEDHIVNIHTKEDNLYFRKGTLARPVLNNSSIVYVDKDKGIMIVSIKEFEKNPNASGNILVKKEEVNASDWSNDIIYYITSNRDALMKLNIATQKRSKIIDLNQGDQYSLGRPDYNDKVVSYQRYIRKTSIVKVDNVFMK